MDSKASAVFCDEDEISVLEPWFSLLQHVRLRSQSDVDVGEVVVEVRAVLDTESASLPATTMVTLLSTVMKTFARSYVHQWNFYRQL